MDHIEKSNFKFIVKFIWKYNYHTRTSKSSRVIFSLYAKNTFFKVK